MVPYAVELMQKSLNIFIYCLRLHGHLYVTVFFLLKTAACDRWSYMAIFDSRPNIFLLPYNLRREILYRKGSSRSTYINICQYIYILEYPDIK